MSKFTQPTKGTNTTTNLAGGSAYKITDEKLKLVTQVFTSFFNEPKYYGDNTTEIVENVRNIAKSDPYFIAQLARYTRNEMYMRSTSQMLVAELTNICKGEGYVKNAIVDVCQRVDDVYEILGYYLANFGKPVPNSLKKGLALALAKFDKYQLSKYQGKGKRPNLPDAIKLCHPIAKPEYKQIIEGTIDIPKTWETMISAIPKTDTARVKAAWEDLIETNKLPYMALLRNLRNLVQANIDNLDKALNYLCNEKAVLGSKQLPFRFYAAYNEMKEINSPNINKVLTALSVAMNISVKNLPKFDGKTIIIVDNSGSMHGELSRKSKLKYIDVAALFGAMSNQLCEDSTIIAFGEYAKYVPLDNQSSIFDNYDKIVNCKVGYSTNLYKAFSLIMENNQTADRIIVFSDMQAYGGDCDYYTQHNKAETQFMQFRNKNGSPVVLHSIDLAGYGTAQFDGQGVDLIAGWNDKIFTFMKYYEEGADNIIKNITDY